MTTDRLAVTVTEAAELTAVGRSTGYALVATGEWPSFTIGRSKRVPVEGLRAWMARRVRAAAPMHSADQPEPRKD